MFKSVWRGLLHLRTFKVQTDMRNLSETVCPAHKDIPLSSKIRYTKSMHLKYKGLTIPGISTKTSSARCHKFYELEHFCSSPETGQRTRTMLYNMIIPK